jgi:hypothetical protein
MRSVETACARHPVKNSFRRRPDARRRPGPLLLDEYRANGRKTLDRVKAAVDHLLGLPGLPGTERCIPISNSGDGTTVVAP